MDSLPAEPQGTPKNTGVGRLSLLQGDLSDPGIELGSLALQAVSLAAELPGKHFFEHLFAIGTQEIFFFKQTNNNTVSVLKKCA